MTARSPHRILLVSGTGDRCGPFGNLLESAGYSVQTRSCRGPAFEALQTDHFDLVLLKACGKGVDGLFTLAHAQMTGKSPQFIVLGDCQSIETAVLAMRMGAFDCLKSDVDEGRLLLSVKQALERSSLYRSAETEGATSRDWNALDMVGRSSGIQLVRELVQKVAPTMATVLITGETGTGKEVTARAIHGLSRSKANLFVPVSCAALPEALLESELFGHRKGSFTGAVTDTTGLLEKAAGGTLFLDEVETLTPAMQGKLLRAVEEKTIQRVGSRHDIPVDFRLLVASNTDLSLKVREGHFREDLFFRFNVFPIEVPPLRQRRVDIPLLTAHFCSQFARQADAPTPRVSVATMNRLMEYDWPGNVRELRNSIERAFILVEDGQPMEIDVPPGGCGGGNCQVLEHCIGEGWDLRQLERQYIQAALRHANGHRNQAAAMLGIDRRTLYRKIKELEKLN